MTYGILFFFAIGSAWNWRSSWRAGSAQNTAVCCAICAMIISYEVPLVLSTVPVLMLAGSLSMVEIVRAQGTETYGGLERWNAFTPWGLAGLVLFLIAACAESNRSPFDLPSGESNYRGFTDMVWFATR